MVSSCGSSPTLSHSYYLGRRGMPGGPGPVGPPGYCQFCEALKMQANRGGQKKG